MTTTYKDYRTQRYFFFWLSVVAYFLPYILTTCALLPLMSEAKAVKWGVGAIVLFVNAMPFVKGIFRAIFAHFPFINGLAFAFICLAFFFTANVFQRYVHTFLFIELAAVLGSFAACVFWHFHRKYKKYNQTFVANKKIGII